MKKLAALLLIVLAPLTAAEKGFTSLVNGKDLTGWKVNENVDTFSVKNGAIVAHGPRSHCFYVGKFRAHTFKDFELKVDVMTEPGSNGGIYILTGYQEQSWPEKGFEVQVNNTFLKDPRKTGSLYQVQDNNAEVAKDNKWFTEHIVVKGNTITVNVDGKQVSQWTQPADWAGSKGFPLRKLAPGTIALQGHDPLSTVHYKNIRIKPLD
ncbi:MAG: DUF1080 domain-containing protein [Bryobacteraceae bacterium]